MRNLSASLVVGLHFFNLVTSVLQMIDNLPVAFTKPLAFQILTEKPIYSMLLAAF